MRSIPNSTTNSYHRSPSIALCILGTLYIISSFSRYAFEGSDVYNRGTDVHTIRAAVDYSESAAGGFRYDSFSDRFAQSYDVLRVNTPMLSFALSTFDCKFTCAVMILTWIFFGLTVIHAFTENAIYHRFVRFFFDYIFYGVALAIGGLNFKNRWYTDGFTKSDCRTLMLSIIAHSIPNLI